MLNELNTFFLSWFNLPYTGLVIVAVLLSLVQLMGLGGEPAGEAEADVDADIDSDIDADADADANAEVDAEADADADAAVSGSVDSPSALGVLASLGVGKAPLFVVLPMLLGAVGLLGWLFNAVASSFLGGVAGWSF